MAVIDEIERLSRRRQALWADGSGGDGEAARIDLRLADLYEQKRHEAASASAERRAEIVKRARVESELERMISGR